MGTKKILKDLISIDSQCTKSNKEIIEYIEKNFFGYILEKFKFKSKNGKLDLYNLVVKIPGDNSNNPLAFVGHTDSVPISNNWTKNPLKADELGGRIYGLGSSDMKSGLACIISSALTLNKIPPQDIYLIFDADEEGSLAGGERLIQDFSLENARVVIPEPTNGNIIYGQKGCLDMRITLFGIAKHSSTANSNYNEKNNAIFKALDTGGSLMQYGREIENRKDSLFGKPIINIGTICGGTAPNITADEAYIEISRRLLPDENIENVYNEIVNIVRDKYSDAKFEKLFWGKPFLTNSNSDFVKYLEELSPSSKLNIQQGWTEAALFDDWGQAVVFGPGLGNQCHKADEYCPISDLEKFTDIYNKLMLGKI